MATVYIEPRPKGRPEGDPIDDYVVEDHADQCPRHLQDAARGNRVGKEGGPRPAPERQEEGGSLARGLKGHHRGSLRRTDALTADFAFGRFVTIGKIDTNGPVVVQRYFVFIANLESDDGGAGRV